MGAWQRYWVIPGHSADDILRDNGGTTLLSNAIYFRYRPAASPVYFQ
ncbi:MAG: hypothetical protein H0W53_20840 [Acidobacteria bacterium]|nr:hypothetical protein [Acidobacteriota bacterium]